MLICIFQKQEHIKADFQLGCLDRYFPNREDLWVLMYDDFWVFIQNNDDNPFLASMLAKTIIEKDIEENQIVMRDL